MAVTTEEQQGVAMVYRTRDLLVRQRTQTISKRWGGRPPGGIECAKVAGVDTSLQGERP